MKKYLTIVHDDFSETQVEEPVSEHGFTYADYLTWNFKERIELIRGQIFKMSPAPATHHQRILGKLHLSIGNYLKDKPCQAFIPPFDVRLPIKNKKKDNEITTVVQPDLTIVCDDSKIDDRGCCGAPDLVVEIISPGNSAHDVKTKFGLYEESGVREYWIIYPADKNLIVYTLNSHGQFEGGKIYADNDSLESFAVPGLTLNVWELFIK